MPSDFSVVTSGATVSARQYAASGGAGRASLVLAHGAGAPQAHPFMVAFATGLASRGFDVVTFNFPYMEARRRVPDRTPVLERCYLDVLARVRASQAIGARPLFIGGKSMGGRMASHLAADHAGEAGPLAGLVFLGYPLHPPGRPDARRDEHLARIDVPMLFVQGSRDAFGTPQELAPVVRDARRAELFEVPGGDHSFAVPRGNSLPGPAVYDWMQDRIAAWMASLLPAGRV